MSNTDDRPTLATIREAAQRIAGHIQTTPVMHSSGLDKMLGGRVGFKCENLQRVGAFKARGAANAVFSLDATELNRGVATHSSGNHGAALALAAAAKGAQAWVVMPDNAPAAKRAAVEGYGATVVPCQPGLNNRETALQKLVDEKGVHIVHPYNDYRVIAGQGTVALEVLEQKPDTEVLIVPLGGGGLLSGCLLAVKEARPDIIVIGVEPEQADDAWQSLNSGEHVIIDSPSTCADGLRASLGTKTLPIIRDLVDDIVRVSEQGIVDATRLIWERLKVVIETSAAVGVAALLEDRYALDGKRAVVVFTGGNLDLDKLPWQA